jgi:hypothetical protein
LALSTGLVAESERYIIGFNEETTIERLEGFRRT